MDNEGPPRGGPSGSSDEPAVHCAPNGIAQGVLRNTGPGDFRDLNDSYVRMA
jgi:hypothetical protein